MFRRHHLFVSLSVALVAGLLNAGCKNDVQATPRVTFESTIEHGTNPIAGCGQTGPWLTIGSFGNPALGRTDPNDNMSPLIDPVRPIDDGGSDQQGTVSISCSVTANGAGFDVAAQASLSGATGGSVTITGNFQTGGSQMNITGNMTAKQGQTFSSNACVVTYDAAVGQGVAAGRVWGQIDCPAANDLGAQMVCATSAQFRFENCTQ